MEILPKERTEISVRRAAIIAGVAILLMALTVPVVEFYIFPKLINYSDSRQTVQNILTNQRLFSTAIFIHFLTVVSDIVSGWALYIFFRRVDRDLAQLSFLVRIVNAAFTIVALANLVQILALLKGLDAPPTTDFNENVLVRLEFFNLQWRFMLVFFGLYMLMVGWLSIKSDYVPTLIGSLILVTGLGYIVDNLKYFFYPQIDTGYLWFTYFGEIIFMFWLLFKGSRLKTID